MKQEQSWVQMEAFNSLVQHGFYSSAVDVLITFITIFPICSTQLYFNHMVSAGINTSQCQFVQFVLHLACWEHYLKGCWFNTMLGDFEESVWIICMGYIFFFLQEPELVYNN